MEQCHKALTSKCVKPPVSKYPLLRATGSQTDKHDGLTPVLLHTRIATDVALCRMAKR